MEKTIMVLKAKSDKASLKTLAFQVGQITTQCTRHNVEIVDCIITFGGAKDALRELKKIDQKKEFNSVVLYSPNQLCKDEEEYQAFVTEIQNQYKAGVRYIRSQF